MITVGVSDDLAADYRAGAIVKDLAKEIQGGGGGNPALQQLVVKPRRVRKRIPKALNI